MHNNFPERAVHTEFRKNVLSWHCKRISRVRPALWRHRYPILLRDITPTCTPRSLSLHFFDQKKVPVLAHIHRIQVVRTVSRHRSRRGKAQERPVCRHSWNGLVTRDGKTGETLKKNSTCCNFKLNICSKQSVRELMEHIKVKMMELPENNFLRTAPGRLR